MMRSVLEIDECAWSAHRARASGRALAATVAARSRAATSAERLPAEPPDTKHPPASLGKPARSARTASASFSA